MLASASTLLTLFELHPSLPLPCCRFIVSEGFESRPPQEGNRMYLVMEYCSGGDLAAFIKRCKRVSEPVAHHLMRQLAAGLKEMWAHNLVHVRLSNTQDRHA